MIWRLGSKRDPDCWCLFDKIPRVLDAHHPSFYIHCTSTTLAATATAQSDRIHHRNPGHGTLVGRNNKAQTYPRRPASPVQVAIVDKSQTRVPSLSLSTTPPPRQVAARSQLSCSTARGLGEGGYLASLGTRSRRHCTSSRWVLDSSSRPSMHALGQLVCFAPSNRVPATTNFTVPVLGRSLEGTGCSANLASRPYGSVDSRFGLDE